MIVDGKVIIEIKAKKSLMPEDTAQLLNYLKATDKEVGLLINFGPKPEISRKVFDNSKKNNWTRINTENSGSKNSKISGLRPEKKC